MKTLALVLGVVQTSVALSAPVCRHPLCLPRALSRLGPQPLLSAQSSSSSAQSTAQSTSLELVASIPNGVSERLEVRSEEDVADAAIDLAARHSLDTDAALELEMSLWTQWFTALESELPPVYEGPTPADGAPLENVVAKFELEESGLILEVANSLVAPDAGLGLFIRCIESVGEVPLDAGTAICGYASGAMRHEADEAGGKTVAFALNSLDTSVFFERNLYAVRDLLAMGDVEAIAGHVSKLDNDGELSSLEIDPEYDGERYFVPDRDQPQPPTILHIGCRANDLATSGEGGDYDEASAEANVLVLVQRLERSEIESGVLVPSRPITTLARSVTIANTQPMELGCRYGSQYWQSFMEESSQ